MLKRLLHVVPMHKGCTPVLNSIAPHKFKLFPLRSLAQRHPVIFGSLLCAVKTSFADYIVQRYVENKKHNAVDFNRVAAFAVFGGLHLGIVNYFLYVPFFTRVLFPSHHSFLLKPLRHKIKDFQGLRDTAGQAMLDVAVIAPFMYYPLFYIIQTGCEETTKPTENWIGEALRRWNNNVKEDTLDYAKCWTPVLLFNFSVCPGFVRIPFIAGVSLFWTMYLSVMRGENEGP